MHLEQLTRRQGTTSLPPVVRNTQPVSRRSDVHHTALSYDARTQIRIVELHVVHRLLVPLPHVARAAARRYSFVTFTEEATPLAVKAVGFVELLDRKVRHCTLPVT